MKSKKWIIIGLISLALIVAELVLLFVWVLPGMKKNKALKSIEDGNVSEAKTLFSELSDSAVNDLRNDVNDIIVYKSNLYLEGKTDYSSFYNTMKAVESVSRYNEMTYEAFKTVNIPRMQTVYEELVTATINKSKDADAKLDEFRHLKRCENSDDDTGIYYGWVNGKDREYEKDVQTAMDSYLKEKYDAYKAGRLDYEKMNIYAATAGSAWYSDYTYEVQTELSYDKYFSEYLDEAKSYYDKDDYWQAMKKIDNVREWYKEEEVYQNNWQSKFDTLYSEAENKAKVYYPQKAIDAAKNGDTATAETIIRELKKHFGDDFDVSQIEQNMHADWQRAYVEYMADWKKNLERDVVEGAAGGDYFEMTKEELEQKLPTKVFLMDIDGDSVPEMLLSAKDTLYIFTYSSSKVVYTGQFPWLGLGDKNTLVAAKTGEEEGINLTMEVLLSFDNAKWSVRSMVAQGEANGQKVYGVGNSPDRADLKTVDEAAYNDAKAAIESEIKKTSLSGGALIDNYEKFIYNYK